MPNWAAGKREARRLLRQYCSPDSLPQLAAVAREELDRPLLTRLRGGKGSVRRRSVLKEFARLSAAVQALRPLDVGEDGDGEYGAVRHPRFELVERAILRACDRAPETMGDVQINHILTKPHYRRVMGRHAGWVMCCQAFDGDSRVVSGSYDGTLRVWDPSNGVTMRIFNLGKEAGGSVHCCSICDDGANKRLAAGTGGEEGTVRLWNLNTGEEVGMLSGHADRVNCCSAYQEGKEGEGVSRLLTGSDDRMLRVWDLSGGGSGKQMHILSGHSSEVLCCKAFEEGSRAISGSADKTLKIWDLYNGVEIQTLRGHDDIVTCCDVSQDGTLVVSGSWDHSIRLWEIDGRAIGEGKKSMLPKASRILKGHNGVVLCCSLFRKDDTRLLSGDADGTMRVWNIRDDAEVHVIKMGNGGVHCCSIVNGGSRIIGGGEDGNLVVWDLPVVSGGESKMLQRSSTQDDETPCN